MRFSASLQTAAFTVSNGIARIPTIFTREGVQNEGFKPFEELQIGADTLEGRPVTFWHPKDRTRETNSEADMWIGFTSGVNARKKDKVLHGFTNIYFEGAPAPYQNAPIKFQEALRAGQGREGSVGYWAFAEQEVGDYKGVPFNRIERDIQFDHYAVGIARGACSVSGGCGLGFDCDQSCTIENPVEYEGKSWIRADHFQNFIKRLNSQEFVRLEDVKKVFVKHLDPEGVEDLKNGLRNNVLEVNQVSDEANQKILDLERAKLKLETDLIKVQEKADKVEGLEEQLGTVNKTLEELKPKIEAYELGQTTKAQEDEVARVDLVKEILKLREEEVTDENVAKWKDWGAPQLQTMKASLEPELEADPAGKGFIPGGGDPTDEKLDAGRGYPVLTEPIGNKLFNQPMPGMPGAVPASTAAPGMTRSYEPIKTPKKKA